jgi:hypothetical protein
MVKSTTTPDWLSADIRKKALQYAEQFDKYGLVILPNPSLDKEYFNALKSESISQREHAWLCEKKATGDNQLAQRNFRSELGAFATEFFSCKKTRDLICSIVNMKVEPSFAASCYTYYESEKDFLGIHTDRELDCKITVLLYLDVRYRQRKGPGEGIKLKLYNHKKGVFSHFYSITPCTNLICILKGSKIPHGRDRLQPGECINLLALCYKGTRNGSK